LTVDIEPVEVATVKTWLRIAITSCVPHRSASDTPNPSSFKTPNVYDLVGARALAKVAQK
jgi:hypothetical protein